MNQQSLFEEYNKKSTPPTQKKKNRKPASTVSGEIHSIILEAREWGENAVTFSTFPQEIDEKFILYVHGKRDSFRLGRKYKITIEET